MLHSGAAFLGTTRANVLRLARELGITTRECDFSLTQVYSAQEAFCTGTYSGIIPVREVDGRTLGEPLPGSVTARIQDAYREEIHRLCPAER